MVLCLGEPPGGFCDVGCCSSFIAVFVILVGVVFTFLGYLLYHATGTPPLLLRHVNASISPEPYPGYFRLFPVPSTVSATVLIGYFLHTGVFYLTFLPHLLLHFWRVA